MQNPTAQTQRNWRATVVKALACWLLLATVPVTLITWKAPRMHAVLCMSWGLILFWIVIGGTLMHRYRDRVRKVVLGIPWRWPVKFVLFCTLLALLEEVVTTTMTNLAPFFGVNVGEAYITASANYLDVVCLHSVVMFFPMFVGWAVILRWFDFSPFAVFILFGLTGTMAETGLFTRPLEAAFWIFIYGLMVYLPAYCLPDRPARKPAWWHYPLAVVAVFPFVALIPVRFVLGFFFPGHPDMHFPPIR